MSDNNKNRKIHIFFLKPFLLEKTIYNLASFTDLHFLVICSSSLMYCAIQLNDISHKTHCVKGARVRSYSDPHFPAFRLNMERYGVSLCIQFKCGKMRTKINPDTDTFYSVTISQIPSSCLIVYRGKADVIFYPSSITISSKDKAILWLDNTSWFWWDKFFSNSIKLLSHYVSINFFYWKTFTFFFSRHLYLSTRFLCILTYLSLVQPWIFY